MTYRNGLIEQIARDTQTLQGDVPDGAPGRAFYEQRIATFRAELAELDASQGETTMTHYCVVYRVGGTHRFEWRRTIAMCASIAQESRACLERSGYLAYIEDWNRSLAIGLPDTFEPGAQPALPGDVGAVRDMENQTPELEAPFALTSPVSTAADALQVGLFD